VFNRLIPHVCNLKAKFQKKTYCMKTNLSWPKWYRVKEIDVKKHTQKNNSTQKPLARIEQYMEEIA